MLCVMFFFFSSRRRHTRCALVTGVQTCALPISLTRRFQVVKIEEPEDAKALAMLRGMARAMADHHKVRILDEALVEAVKLSSRYIAGRQLPDKAVSVLDTACAKIAIGQNSIPAEIEDARQQRAVLATEDRKRT